MFQIGGSANGRTSQARDMLWQIKRTSPFEGLKPPARPESLGAYPCRRHVTDHVPPRGQISLVGGARKLNSFGGEK